MKTSSTKTTFAIVLTLVLVCVGVYYYMYRSLIKSNAEVAILSGELAKDGAKQEKTEALRQSIEKSTEDRTLLDSLFVKKDQVADLIQQLETLAALSSITKTFSVDSASDDNLDPFDKEKLHISVSTAGTWKNTSRFLALLENLPYKVSISGASLDLVGSEQQASKALPGDLLWRGTFQLDFIKEK